MTGQWSESHKNMMVFNGRGNPELGEAVAKELGIELTPTTTRDFANGEIFVRFEESVRGADCFVLQSHAQPLNKLVMEQLIMIDALKRGSAKRITAILPFYPYARQDKKHRGREPISARLIADLLTAAGADRVLTMDLHAAQIQGFFDIPVDNLMGSHLFVKHFIKMFGKGNEDVMVVSPDVGSTARARAFSLKLGTNMAIVDKRRERANQSEVMNIIGSVEGKSCILLDDIVDTAGSLCGAAKAIKELGGAKKVYACATHGVLSGPAIQRIEESCIEELLLLDTIPYPADKPKCDKIRYISTAAVFAEAIRRIYEEVSISNLFD